MLRHSGKGAIDMLDLGKSKDLQALYKTGCGSCQSLFTMEMHTFKAAAWPAAGQAATPHSAVSLHTLKACLRRELSYMHLHGRHHCIQMFSTGMYGQKLLLHIMQSVLARDATAYHQATTAWYIKKTLMIANQHEETGVCWQQTLQLYTTIICC